MLRINFLAGFSLFASVVDATKIFDEIEPNVYEKGHKKDIWVGHLISRHTMKEEPFSYKLFCPEDDIKEARETYDPNLGQSHKSNIDSYDVKWKTSFFDVSSPSRFCCLADCIFLILVPYLRKFSDRND